jgi:hypothetical protein
LELHKKDFSSEKRSTPIKSGICPFGNSRASVDENEDATISTEGDKIISWAVMYLGPLTDFCNLICWSNDAHLFDTSLFYGYAPMINSISSLDIFSLVK